MKFLKPFLKKSIASLLVMQGALLSQELLHVNVKGVEVPVVFEQSTTLPIVSLQLVMQVAGSIEDSTTPGLARFVASMLGEGTKTLGAVGFAKKLEQRAINLSANAGTETLVFELGALKEAFDEGIVHLNALLQEPNFTKESMEKVRLMTLGGISRRASDFDYVATTALRGLMFEGTPLAHPGLGTTEAIKALRLKEVEAFFRTRMDLSNAIVVIGGDLSQEEAKAYAKKVLATLDVGAKRPLPYAEVTKTPNVSVLQKPSEQAYIYFGAPFYMQSGDADAHKARVAAFILGESGFGSRLMEEIRVKRGLAYSAYGKISVNRSSSKFTGHLQTKNENKDEAMALVRQVVDMFIKEGVSEEELAQAKRFLLGSEPLRTETLSQRLSRAFFEYYRGFVLGYSKEQLYKIETLSLEELNAFIASHAEIAQLSFAVVTNVDAAQ
ncbi:MAG: insulinase family protein [Campylobacterales bacterium]|nr:insulinase family protein [Campylobacterales bacterium]